MSAPQSGNDRASSPTGANWLLFVFRAWATSIEVFLHRGFGERYVGAQGAAVLLLVPVYCLCCEGYDLGPMMYFLVAYLAMCIVARLGVVARRRRGEYGHSQYTGRPLIMWLLPGWDEVKVKANAEPLLIIVIGFFTLPCPLPSASTCSSARSAWPQRRGRRPFLSTNSRLT